MQRTVLSLLITSVLSAAPAAAQSTALQSREELNWGVQAYKQTHYVEAVSHFKQAVVLDPANRNAALYLATAYMVQWAPGLDTPENRSNYELAKQGFEAVLDKDSSNSLALASLASLAFQSALSGTDEQKTAGLQEAKKWNQRRIDNDPQDSEAWYYLGVIGWTEAYPALQAARKSSAMRVDQAGPLPDASARDDLKAKYGELIEHGMQSLKKCMEFDEDKDDAMAYMNLLLREKALLEDSPAAAKADIEQAEDWTKKAVELKQKKAAGPPPQ